MPSQEEVVALLQQLRKQESKVTDQAAYSDVESVPFDLREIGLAGELTLSIRQDAADQFAYVMHVPSIATGAEVIIEDKYFNPKQSIPASLEHSQRIWPRVLECNELFSVYVSKPHNLLELVKNEFTGKLEGLKEVHIPEKTQSAKSSLSLLRQPAPIKDFVRGNALYYPFQPGGVDEEEKPDRAPAHHAVLTGEEELESMENRRNLLSVPPGFAEPAKAAPEKEVGVVVVGSNPAGLLAPYTVTAEEEEYYRAIDESRHEEELRRKTRITLEDLFGNAGENPFAIPEMEKQIEQFVSASIEEAKETDQKAEELKAQLQQAEQGPRRSEAGLLAGLRRRDSLDNLLDIEGARNLLGAGVGKKDNEEKKTWAVMERIPNIAEKFHEWVPEMAIEYPFDLDVFQKEAIYHLENNESVFVSAHTSAGKTVVAEYAIALAQKHLTRVIYTSPIKTLSNQKFREFKQTFGDVGILTGDVQINPTATCLIMTTEILRSMLYKGADLIRDVEWVIFDEVHYINDLERGVVWEEVIIMLPEHVNIILLSATVPNTFEFADWIGRTKKKNIYVISTTKRPVPLEHHLYYNGEIYKIVDATGTFLNDGYRKALAANKAKKDKSPNTTNYKVGQAKIKTEKNEWIKIIDHLRKKTLLPVVVFTFSKKKCEEIAYGLTQTDLTNGGEKSEIHVFIEQCVSRLKGTDRELPQVLRIKDLLKRGIGVHHSGLLPIVKEVVEMLFSRGLVKVLFATETFAMGVNMPARTVIFNSIRKHDGRQFRELLAGEYIQMSGRAGRRGLDNTGVVIITCWEDIPEEHVLQTMILGKPTKLESQFRLKYNMMLNLMRIEDFRVEDMIKRSFSEFHTQRLLPKGHKELLAKNETYLQQLETIDCIYGEPTIDSYYTHVSNLENVEKLLQERIMQSKPGLAALVPGRVVVVRTQLYGHTLGAILKMSSAPVQADSPIGGETKKTFQLLVLRSSASHKPVNPSPSRLPPYSPLLFPQQDVNKGKSLADVLDNVPSSDILALCHAKINVPKGRSPEALKPAAAELIKLWESNPEDGPPVLHPMKDLKIKELEFAELAAQKDKLIEKMRANKCSKCPLLNDQYDKIDRSMKLRKNLENLKFALSDSNLNLLPEFEKRVEVLQRLKYIDADRTVQLKGRVACEINACDELILTEMIFENVFTSLTPEEAVSLLSCMICETKDASEPSLTDKLEHEKENLINLTMTLGKLQQECGLEVTPTEYKKQLNFGLMEVAYEWARGMPFAEICKLTNIQEGSIVRNIIQLDQACREVRNAARVIGDSALYAKMEEASSLIKRDIVFAASLYIT